MAIKFRHLVESSNHQNLFIQLHYSGRLNGHFVCTSTLFPTVAVIAAPLPSLATSVDTATFMRDYLRWRLSLSVLNQRLECYRVTVVGETWRQELGLSRRNSQ